MAPTAAMILLENQAHQHQHHHHQGGVATRVISRVADWVNSPSLLFPVANMLTHHHHRFEFEQQKQKQEQDQGQKSCDEGSNEKGRRFQEAFEMSYW